MLGDWEVWLRLFVVASFGVGAYRAYRNGIRAGQWSPKGFFLIVGVALAYAAIGIASMLALIELLGPGYGGTVGALFLGYAVLGLLLVVWISFKIARKYRPRRDSSDGPASNGTP